MVGGKIVPVIDGSPSTSSSFSSFSNFSSSVGIFLQVLQFLTCGSGGCSPLFHLISWKLEVD